LFEGLFPKQLARYFLEFLCNVILRFEKKEKQNESEGKMLNQNAEENILTL
jgi:hypothetical protein